MRKIELGSTGLMVSEVAFGGIPIQRLSDDGAVRVVQQCLDMGVNFLDTAHGYGPSEERIGRTIAGRREGLVLASKANGQVIQSLILKKREIYGYTHGEGSGTLRLFALPHLCRRRYRALLCTRQDPNGRRAARVPLPDMPGTHREQPQRPGVLPARQAG